MENLYSSIEIRYIRNNDFKYPYKLFETKSVRFPFVKYEEHLSSINDYIYFNNNNIYNKLEILEEKYNILPNDSRNKETLSLDGKSEKYIYFDDYDIEDEEYLSWKYLTEEVNKCSNIVLLLAFLEGTLKEIYELEENKDKFKSKGTSKIDFYISGISSLYNYNIKEKIESDLEIINQAKIIRNIYIHEWDAYYNTEHNEILDKDLKKFKISLLINSISNIIEECENSIIISKKWED